MVLPKDETSEEGKEEEEDEDENTVTENIIIKMEPEDILYNFNEYVDYEDSGKVLDAKDNFSNVDSKDGLDKYSPGSDCTDQKECLDKDGLYRLKSMDKEKLPKLDGTHSGYDTPPHEEHIDNNQFDDDLGAHVQTSVVIQDPVNEKVLTEAAISSGEMDDAEGLSSVGGSGGGSGDTDSVVSEVDCGTYRCDSCEFVTSSLPELNRHKWFHSKMELRKSCPECGLRFTTTYKMKRHFRIHSGEKPYKCDVCGFATNHPSSFKYHMRSHFGVKPYVCRLCDFRSVSCTMLTRHLRVHTGEKPFQCHLCDFKARAKGTLKSHIRRHTGERPFACDHCDKSFVTSSALRKHSVVHDRKKEYKCILCNTSFETRQESREHANSHGYNYSCEHCGCKPGSRVRLKVHLEKNQSGAPFKCKICDESFDFKCVFAKHTVQHDEYRPFKCDQCDYRGPTSSSLRFHTRTKHVLGLGNLSVTIAVSFLTRKRRLSRIFV